MKDMIVKRLMLLLVSLVLFAQTSAVITFEDYPVWLDICKYCPRGVALWSFTQTAGVSGKLQFTPLSTQPPAVALDFVQPTTMFWATKRVGATAISLDVDVSGPTVKGLDVMFRAKDDSIVCRFLLFSGGTATVSCPSAAYIAMENYDRTQWRVDNLRYTLNP